MFGFGKQAGSRKASQAADQFVQRFETQPSAAQVAPSFPNPLEIFFEGNVEGPGIWKWRHYFKLYHRHFEKFVGRDVKILEIGIYSGGSLRMWKSYFGDSAHIYGVDIEPSCEIYEEETITVKIGDQQNKDFWADFLKTAPKLDIVIDDGGHEYEQQKTTIEEVLPFMAPGGVFICEDVHGTDNRFTLYAARLAAHLNESARMTNLTSNEGDDERRLINPTSEFQKHVKCISFYPFSIVIEMHDAPVSELVASKHGTQWQPFLK